MAKKLSKVQLRRIKIFGSLSLIIIIYFFCSLAYNVYTIYDLTLQKKELEINYRKLQEEAETLKKDIEKLSDEKYLADYAREKYLYSKQGEYIIQLDAIEETEENLNKINIQLNKDYIILAIFILVFIYIFIHIKPKKRNKKTL